MAPVPTGYSSGYLGGVATGRIAFPFQSCWGITFMLVIRGAITEFSTAEGLESCVLNPNEPFWSKVLIRCIRKRESRSEVLEVPVVIAGPAICFTRPVEAEQRCLVRGRAIQHSLTALVKPVTHVDRGRHFEPIGFPGW